ncbi:MAG: ATP-binding cassette domain-containing protein [Myxococcota bacterium]|jgi:phospholipid/cholesterol/gamma-HCH transport system ATP-binding protein|nr:ATP-binding cassette domain-containing protein [Myxococcota bacterium]
MIEYDRVSISLGGQPVLRDISFSIEAGEIFCIIGKSGVGKSVMIKQLVGLLRPDSGAIRFEGQDVCGMDERGLMALRRECGMVFQQATLFDSMTCLENVALPLRVHYDLPEHRAQERAMGYLAQLGVSHLAEREPAALGPGLRKLVAIARTMTLQPKALLFDEPTTGLDPLAARKFDKLVKGPLARAGITQVVVSHDVRSVFDIADRVVMLHEGEVRFLGTSGELSECEDRVVRGFIEGKPEL